MTKEQAQREFDKWKVKLVENGIPVAKDIAPEIRFSKATSWFGMTEPRREQNGKLYKFRIAFSVYHLESSDKAIINTIIHELLHTCPGCLNHGEKWKSYARVCKEKFGYNIERCGGDKDDEEILKKAAKVRFHGGHKLICIECGQEFNRSRESNFTLHPDWYRCNCGGEIKRLY